MSETTVDTLDIKQVANRLGVSRSTALRNARRGAWPWIYKLTSGPTAPWRASREGMEKWLKERELGNGVH